MKIQKKGFTILELLIVIAIIGIIATVVLISIDPLERARSAKTAKVVQEMLGIKNAVAIYVLDTGQFPNNCRLNCTAATDPFLSAQGVSGWNGPYMKSGLWDRAHPWGGQLGLVLYDSNSNGRNEVWLVLDDDAPGTGYSDNSGKVPDDSLQEIDEKVDDGDTGTGDMFIGAGTGIFPDGEGAWRVYRVGEDNN